MKEQIWMRDVKIVNSIHDEIVVCCKFPLQDETLATMIYEMEHVLPLDVPIKAEGLVVSNWADAK